MIVPVLLNVIWVFVQLHCFESDEFLRLQSFLDGLDLCEFRCACRQHKGAVTNLVFFSTRDVLEMLEFGAVAQRVRAVKMLSRLQSHIGPDHPRCCVLLRKFLCRKGFFLMPEYKLVSETYVRFLDMQQDLTWLELMSKRSIALDGT